MKAAIEIMMNKWKKEMKTKLDRKIKQRIKNLEPKRKRDGKMKDWKKHNKKRMAKTRKKRNGKKNKE